MKLKIKVILTLLILLFSINIGYADTGNVIFSGSDEKIFPGYTTHQHNAWDLPGTRLKIKDVSYHDGLTFISYKIPDVYWKGTSDNSKWMSTNYHIGAALIGTGTVGINRYSGYRMVYFLFNDDLSFSGYSGAQDITVSNPGISSNRLGIDNQGFNDVIYISDNSNNRLYVTEIIIQHEYYASYPYTLSETSTLLNFYLDREPSKTALKVKIDNQYQTIFSESSFLTTDIDFFDVDTINKSWTIELQHETSGSKEYIYYSFPPDVPDTHCRIDVDDIDIGDSINVSYFNINHLRNNPNTYGNSEYTTCNLNLQIIANRGYYEELIYQDFITNETDNTFYYSSDTLTQGIYYAQINKELGSLNDYAVRSTFVISEPLNYSIIVNPNDVYVGDNINIIYKSLNQSTLSVYDNSSTLIKQYLNIQNEGQKIFQIPPDLQYDNTYPNWYVYLNDTGNSSNNLKYNFSVNWRVYTEPEPTPQPTEQYYNESIEDNIDELKDGINPIKELIFGISTIFVDDPDYDNNNVVDVNEISVWLNSLISMAIIIFIYILYLVYKRG